MPNAPITQEEMEKATVRITHRSSSADAATLKRRAQKQAQKNRSLGPGWNNNRSTWVLPAMPDRDLMPDDEIVLSAYDKAVSTIAYGKVMEQRIKDIPSEIEKLRSDYEAASQKAIEGNKKLPAVPSEIAELESELETTKASIGKVRSTAWAHFKEFGKISAPLMGKLANAALAQLESAVKALDELKTQLDEQIERARHAHGLIFYSESFQQGPRFQPSPSPDLAEAQKALAAGVTSERFYAKRVREGQKS